MCFKNIQFFGRYYKQLIIQNIFVYLTMVKLYSQLGVFTQPLKNGTFPQSLLDSIAKTDEHENVTLKRIVEFSEDEKKDIIGNIIK